MAMGALFLYGYICNYSRRSGMELHSRSNFNTGCLTYQVVADGYKDRAVVVDFQLDENRSVLAALPCPHLRTVQRTVRTPVTDLEIIKMAW
jgi:hypothetical protein